MTEEQHNSWVRVVLILALIAASATCVITGHEDAAFMFGVTLFYLCLGVL